MKTIIHVHQQKIRGNIKRAAQGEPLEPPVIVRLDGKSHHVNDVYIYNSLGKVIGILKYRPDKPLSCGARLWIELYDCETVFEEDMAYCHT